MASSRKRPSASAAARGALGAPLEQFLRDAGFADIEITDMTETWKPFVTGRMNGFRAEEARNVAVHGRLVFDALDEFYTTMDRLFAGGNLGGVRVVATSP